MVYLFLKPVIRLALLLFCRRVILVNPSKLEQKGPLLMVANHPNSFLDAIIIAAYTKNPIHFLARGDAFKKIHHRYLLGLLNMLPIYRLKEGKENLYLNEYAFKKSDEILRKGGILLLFIEGISKNTNQIQPFKKGAARIAAAYTGSQPLKLVPIALTYNDFYIYGKTVKLEMGEMVLANQILPYTQEAQNLKYFNQYFYAKIEALIGKPNQQEAEENSWILQNLAVLGRLLHWPLYSLLRAYVAKRTVGTAFYDAVLFGALFFSYPCYLLLIVFILAKFGTSIWMIGLVLILFPLTARLVLLVNRRSSTL